MSKPGFRVYFVPHGPDGEGRRLLVGILMRTWDAMFDKAPPSAIGATEEDVLEDLEREMLERVARGEDEIERYLWREDFTVHEVNIVAHPLTTVKKRPVIGKQPIPIRLQYAACRLADGGFRVALPRFGGFFILEDLSLAAEVLRAAVSSWLSGAAPRELYDFRSEGTEWVRAFRPALLDRAPPAAEDDESASFPELSRVADDLVARAKKDRLGPIVGEFPALAEVLGLSGKTGLLPSLLVVGPEGAGKSTFVRRLARAYAKGALPKDVRAPRVWSTTADRIIAGMVYLGMWQERCLTLIHELGGEGDYLHVGELGAFLEPQPDGTSIAEMFDGPVAAGQLSLIAECTPAELVRATRVFPSFVARFKVVRIDALTPASTLALVGPYVERRRAPPLHPDAARKLVELVSSFARSAALPGSVFRFLDWFARHEESTKPIAAADTAATARGIVHPTDVTAAFSRWSGVPLDILSDDVSAGAAHFADRLRARVIGQDEACDACGRVLARFKARLHDPERPTASLLFVGPTGVGKTELAKQLARSTFGDDQRLVRVDMSEYGTWGAAARLSDVSPGARSLARAIAEQPLSVVLLDEIEKAHPEVFDVLLGLLDEGRLTDSAGRLVDFRGTIVVMTSNLGATDKRRMSFTGESAADFQRAVRDQFRPEMRNRIDYVVEFKPLSIESVTRIVDLELDKVQARTGLVRRGVRLVATREAKERLAVLGYEPARGARPLRRVIEELVVVPIATALAAHPSRRGGEARVEVEGEAVTVGFVD
ncbi:MAG: AAA family ATPase [Polyangiaceae bacterium]